VAAIDRHNNAGTTTAQAATGWRHVGAGITNSEKVSPKDTLKVSRNLRTI
jgi:hypothetical protein